MLSSVPPFCPPDASSIISPFLLLLPQVMTNEEYLQTLPNGCWVENRPLLRTTGFGKCEVYLVHDMLSNLHIYGLLRDRSITGYQWALCTQE